MVFSSKNSMTMQFYNLVFDEETKFPKILQPLKVDLYFHVQLQYNDIPVPQCFGQGNNAQLKKS